MKCLFQGEWTRKFGVGFLLAALSGLDGGRLEALRLMHVYV